MEITSEIINESDEVYSSFVETTLQNMFNFYPVAMDAERTLKFVISEDIRKLMKNEILRGIYASSFNKQRA